VNKTFQTRFLHKCRLNTFFEFRECVDSVKTYEVVLNNCKARVDSIVCLASRESSIIQSVANSLLDQVLTVMQKPSYNNTIIRKDQISLLLIIGYNTKYNLLVRIFRTTVDL
jgi:hypothetical protein